MKIQNIPKGARVGLLLPHYDDEVFFLAYMQSLEVKQVSFEFIYLTPSEGMRNKFSRDVRLRETKNFLFALGKLTGNNIHDVGIQINSKDGYLHMKLEQAEEAIRSIMQKKSIQILASPMYEGGHQDHDAAAILNFKIGHSAFVESHFIPSYTYSGNFPYYSVMRIPKVQIGEIQKIKITSRKFFIIFPVYFRSQWRSWIGLFPFIFVKAILRSSTCYVSKLNILNLELKNFFYSNRKRIETTIVLDFFRQYIEEEKK